MISREVIEYFTEKLGLNVHMSQTDMIIFFASLSGYLSHSRTGNSSGRTFETIKKNLDELYEFLKSIGCNEKEMIRIIGDSPDMLNIEVEKLYKKYIILGVLEDCKNYKQFRKRMIIARPKDFRTSLETVYARYDFAVSVGYPVEKISWSMLLHDSNREYAKKFVKGAYYKPYRVFETIEECSHEMLLEKFPVDETVIENLKAIDVNKEVVMNFEKRNEEPVPGM